MLPATNPKEKSVASKIFTKLAVAANSFFEKIADLNTMRAVVVIASTMIGFTMDDENIEYYVLVGVAIAQTIALLLPDDEEGNNKKKDEEEDANIDSYGPDESEK